MSDVRCEIVADPTAPTINESVDRYLSFALEYADRVDPVTWIGEEDDDAAEDP